MERKASINGQNIKYDTSKNVAQTTQAELTNKLISTLHTASARFVKLSQEFKGGDIYLLYQSSHSRTEAMPNLNDPFVTDFKQQFNKTAISIGKACGSARQDVIDTTTLKSLTTTALSDLCDLQKLSGAKANALFEHAYCDTDVTIMKYHNEFTDKLDREIGDFSIIQSLVSELETYFPPYE